MTPTDRGQKHVLALPPRTARPAARRTAGIAAVLALVLAFAAFGSASAAADSTDPTTTTVLTVSPSLASPGDTITFTATVTGIGGNPTGTVTFATSTVSGSTIFGSAALAPVPGSGTDSQAVFATTSFAAGAYSITASYRSDDFANFFNSTSSGVALNVSSVVIHNTTTTLSSAPATVTVGEPVTLTAVVSESDGGGLIPTGDVIFSANDVHLGIGALDATGTARLIVPDFLAGTYLITTSYSGDVFNRSSGASLFITVLGGPTSAVQTTTTVTVTPDRIVAGQSVALAAHVVQTGTPTPPPAGPVVTFTANGNWVGEAPLDANGNATVTVSGWITGTYTIGASYVGDINDRASSGSASLGVVANTTPLTVTGPSVSIAYGGAVPALTPAYAGFVNGDTAASLDAQATCTTTATAASPVGSYPVTCSGAAGSLYTISYVDGSVTIAPAVLTVAAVNASITAGQPIPAFTATITGFKNGETLATSWVTGSPSCTTTATASSPAGTYSITCTQGTLAATNYTFAFVAGTLTVTSASPPVTCAGGKQSDDDHDSHGRNDRRSHCESLLANPSPGSGARVSASQKMTIVYMDETPIGTGALAPTALLSTGQLLPVTVTPTSRQPRHWVDDNGGSAGNRYQSLLTFFLPSDLAPGKYSILVTVHDSDGDLDQWIWQVKVGRSSGHDDDEHDWQSIFSRLLAALGWFNR